MSMFSTGILVLTSPLHTLPLRIAPVLSSAAQVVERTLYVHLHPGLNLGVGGGQPRPVFIPPVVDLSSLITGLYSNAANVCGHLDVRVLLTNVRAQPNNASSPETGGTGVACNPFPSPQPLSHSPEVVLTDFALQDPGQSPLVAQCLQRYTGYCYVCTPGLASVLLHPQLQKLEEEVEKEGQKDDWDSRSERMETYSEVVVGGTFDRLHGAHKTLLNISCLLANKRFLIGVCDQELLKKKVLKELIEPYALRVQRLHEFLQDVKPSLQYEIVPLSDPFGPSVIDPQLQCIVVSEETRRGGEAVNKKRLENGLPGLVLHEIQLLKDAHHTEMEEEKISSSSLRSRLLGTLLTDPKNKSHLPLVPYVIGLTGSSGSGKSSIAQQLEAMGAVRIDSDQLGHETYQPGEVAYNRVLEEFGSGADLINEDKTINRRALGRKVFGNKTISGDLLPYLTSLINSSLTAGYVPSVFKRARVAPLLKKPTLDPSDVNNYRPVSLLSFLSKTLERAVLGQLSCYLSQNDLLDPNQSGFKTSHSTETALLCVTEALRTAKANSLSSALILLDLSAAFDTVNHQILLSTLSELGISGAAHAWIASYLTGRSYQVAWRESVSAPRALTTGVPQGSVLGPLLFSLYTKSLGSVISSHGLSYHCYADDTQLIFSFPPSDNQVVNRISACLADISVWMTDHHLKLNLGKTELLFLPGKDCPFHDLAITVDNSIVSSSQSAKNLGVILDNTLSFSTNIKAVTRSCRFMLYNIRRVRPCLTQEAAQVLIQALVISRLDYCNSLLAGLPACAIKPLQLIQNAAARLVFNFPKFSHVTPLLRSLHWLPVEARIRYKTMVLAYGAVRGTAPPYLQALIRPYTQTRALRSSTSGLLASLPLRKYSSRSAQSKLFAALAPQWWNKLPHDARSAESITTFRRHLKPHLFKEYLG
ncbi:bifunctional coenzyme A synthase isoform X2 [Salvelinus alpinus]|uniref:bifunctional coenzyme A synthase isoform X2 n=2 Tax=Salvelinus alpinus TaxID=8036 RepID=UPI0039FD3378